MTKQIITQKELKELLEYNADTGLFTWLKNKGHARVGDKCGSLDTKGYPTTSIKTKAYRLHRLAWLYTNGSFPPEDIDHINGNRADNRLINLRCVSRSENHKNRMISPLNKSGLMGVSWDKSRVRWMATIAINKKQTNLGRFKDFFEACCARKAAEVKHNYHENHGRVM